MVKDGHGCLRHFHRHALIGSLGDVQTRLVELRVTMQKTRPGEVKGGTSGGLAGKQCYRVQQQMEGCVCFLTLYIFHCAYCLFVPFFLLTIY